MRRVTRAGDGRARPSTGRAALPHRDLLPPPEASGKQFLDGTRAIGPKDDVTGAGVFHNLSESTAIQRPPANPSVPSWLAVTAMSELADRGVQLKHDVNGM